MPSPIDNKLFDEKKIIPFLTKKIKKEMLMRDLSGKEVAKKADMPETYLSGVLGTRPTNNAQVYRKISHAIGLSDREFDNMVQEAQREAFGGGDANIDYALSSELGDNPKAVNEVKNFIEFVKDKYK